MFVLRPDAEAKCNGLAWARKASATQYLIAAQLDVEARIATALLVWVLNWRQFGDRSARSFLQPRGFSKFFK